LGEKPFRYWKNLGGYESIVVRPKKKKESLEATKFGILWWQVKKSAHCNEGGKRVSFGVGNQKYGPLGVAFVQPMPAWGGKVLQMKDEWPCAA